MKKDNTFTEEFVKTYDRFKMTGVRTLIYENRYYLIKINGFFNDGIPNFNTTAFDIKIKDINFPSIKLNIRMEYSLNYELILMTDKKSIDEYINGLQYVRENIDYILDVAKKMLEEFKTIPE